jgi:hypothetical protein
MSDRKEYERQLALLVDDDVLESGDKTTALLALLIEIQLDMRASLDRLVRAI